MIPLSPSQVRFQNLANLAVGGSGIALAWYKYGAQVRDEFSRVSGRAELLWHDSHIVFSPLLVFAAGLIWKSHVWPKLKGFSWRRKDRLKALSGIALVGMLIPMVASGLLIQITAEEGWRRVWSVSHGVTGALWVCAFLLHLVGSAARAKVRARGKASSGS